MKIKEYLENEKVTCRKLNRDSEEDTAKSQGELGPCRGLLIPSPEDKAQRNPSGTQRRGLRSQMAGRWVKDS